MSLATYQNVSGYNLIRGMPPSLDSYIDETETPNLSSFAQSVPAQKVITFRSKVTIAGSRVFIPEQEFSIHWANNEIRIESKPTNAWPKIIIDLLADSSGIFNKIKGTQVFPSEDTAEAEIKYTRFNWAIGHHSIFSIALPKIGNISFHVGKFSEGELTVLTERAKLFRKLRFLEDAFKINISLPKYVQTADVKNIDYIYRGLTEGEFVVRGDGLNLAIPEKDINWLAAPFSEIGDFPQSSEWYRDYFGNTVYLFGRKLDIGTVSVRLEKAIYSGAPNVQLPNHDLQKAVGVRFDVLDHQIYFRFDNYADKGKKKLQERLARFKYEFLRDDPQALLNLIDDPLIRDVSPEEANWITVGWLQYNRFPDRYCPQEPMLDETNKIWRVPLYLVYASGEGGEVGELQIDIKTGKVISHTPVDTIKAKGEILAEKLMHARETTPIFAGD